MQKEHFIILFWWHGVDVLKRAVNELFLVHVHGFQEYGQNRFIQLQ